MGKTFLPRFERMAAELWEHPDIKVKELATPLPASERELAAAKRKAGGRLPEGLEEFYREMNGFLLKWQLKPEKSGGADEGGTGSVEILPVGEVFKDWKGSVWFDDFEGGDRFKAVRPLDFFAPEACAALRHAEPEGFAPNIHYHYLGEFLCDTGYSFEEYVERLLNSRGFFYWIETLCEDTQASPQAGEFLRRAPLLFRDFEPSLFRPGPARRKG